MDYLQVWVIYDTLIICCYDVTVIFRGEETQMTALNTTVLHNY